MNPYQKLLNRKRKWTPVQVTAGACMEGAEKTILRALALRHMELPVGDFITDALSNDVPEVARELLESNVRDEENHDVALGYIANAYGVDEKAESEALRLRDAWVSHPDHTITKAMVAERAVFFVLLPFFRANGDAGMRTTSADVSRDEQNHDLALGYIANAYGTDPKAEAEALRLRDAWTAHPDHTTVSYTHLTLPTKA